MIVSDRIAEPFATEGVSFLHGFTFGGHPVSCAVALANLDVIENDKLIEHVLENESAFRATLEKLRDLPIVGDIRGMGYFYGIELVKNSRTRETGGSGLGLNGMKREAKKANQAKNRHKKRQAGSHQKLRKKKKAGEKWTNRARLARHKALWTIRWVKEPLKIMLKHLK